MAENGRVAMLATLPMAKVVLVGAGRETTSIIKKYLLDWPVDMSEIPVVDRT
jgi:hypothetical protein